MPPPPPLTNSISRLWSDRRAGLDRREIPRREVLSRVERERRARVDRRRGPERRSTLDRRGRSRRVSGTESPGEHLRNALQLLSQPTLTGSLEPDPRADLAAALDRLRLALQLLEHRSGL
ncbi:MAG TPA: hypothetical protein VF890_07805 [Gemmatimonadales bacterium]